MNEIQMMFRAGKEFPNENAIDRLRDIKENNMLYNGKQRDVFIDDLLIRLDLAGVEHTERYSNGNSRRLSSSSMLETYKSIFTSINAHFPIIQTYANLLFGEGLKITDKNEDRDKWLNGSQSDDGDIIENGWLYEQKFSEKLHKGIISAGKRGDAIYKLWENEEGKAILSLIRSEYWFPIVSSFDDNMIIADAIAKEVNVSDEMYSRHSGASESGKKKILRVEIYEKGKNIYKVFLMKDNKIVKQISWDETIVEIIGNSPENVYIGENGFDLIEDTGYSYSMIQRFPFRSKDDSIFGQALYTESSKTLERDLCIRNTQIGRIEDKNSDPGMYGPGQNISVNPMTG